MQPGQMAYDRAITVFSHDGRLFQVEYARVAVTRGNTTAGLKFKDGTVLMADKKIASRLLETSSIEKIFQIDEHVGCATSGLVAGVDDLGVHLYETHPSGALVSYKAGSIGAGRNTVMEMFEEKYKESMG